MIPVPKVLFVFPPPHKFKELPYTQVRTVDPHSQQKLPVDVTFLLLVYKKFSTILGRLLVG